MLDLGRESWDRNRSMSGSISDRRRQELIMDSKGQELLKGSKGTGIVKRQ